MTHEEIDDELGTLIARETTKIDDTTGSMTHVGCLAELVRALAKRLREVEDELSTMRLRQAGRP